MSVTGLLILASVMANGLNRRYGGRFLYEMNRLFNVNSPADVSAWFGSAVLLMCCLALVIIWRWQRAEKNQFHWHWLGLAALFGLLSVDKSLAVHRAAVAALGVVQTRLHLPGQTWLALCGLIAVALACVYLGFTRGLQPSIRNMFVLSGVVYITGALVLDQFGAGISARLGNTTLVKLLVPNVEEGMEMVGAILFLYTFTQYLASTNLLFQLQNEPESQHHVEAETAQSTLV